jgi:DNA-binding protein HU-beta
MRKADIVAAVADKTGIAKVDVLVALEQFFSEVRDTMGNGENVYIRGFGSFVIKKRAAKTGRNIKRNKTVQIPEHYIPAFKPAKIFTEHVKTNVHALPDDKDGGKED